MKFIENYVEEYVQEPGIDGMYKAVRDAAAVCYQTDTEKMKLSPKEFVEQVLLNNGHTRPLEFATVYLKIPGMAYETPRPFDSRMFFKYEKYMATPLWTHLSGLRSDGNWYITTNLRVIMQGSYRTDKEAWENGYDRNWLNDVYEFWCEPTEDHDKRHTFSMFMSRGCTDDNRTHITQSSMCESTRYCNYSKGKFGSEMTFIWPYWIDSAKMNDFNNCKGELYEAYKKMLVSNCTYDATNKDATIMMHYHLDEMCYLNTVDANMLALQPQQAKRFFPLGAKAELRLCGYDEAWQNFFWRRCDGHADPECQKTAEMIKKIYFSKER